jgi:membrane protease subunit HflK
VPQPPNLEDILRRGQDRLREVLPGGGNKGKILALAVAALVLIWLLSGFYRVQADQQGVVLRFGKWVETTQPGLNYHLPAPIESVVTPSVTRVNRIEIGFRSGAEIGRTGPVRGVGEESLMLTGDENIVDVNFTVFWRIKDAGMFLFNIRRPEPTVKSAAESAMREIIGQTPIALALAEGRRDIEERTFRLMQQILDSYGSGIEITQVRLQKVDPPAAVLDAFRDVQRAEADQERARNEAESYRNDVIPRARGEAERMIQEAEAYRQQVVAKAQGEAERFISILSAYRLAPDVTAKRLYLETMEDVLSGVEKVIIDSGSAGAPGVVPYLPLPELRKRSGNSQGGAK